MDASGIWGHTATDHYSETFMNTTTRTPAISADIAGNVLTLTGANGLKIVVDAYALTDDMRMAAMMHGLKQKLVDAAAISRDTDTGRAADINTKMQAVKEVADRLYAGEWNKTRAGEGVATGGLLLRALLRMYDGRKTKEELLAFIAGKTDAEKAALRASPKVAPIIAAIKDEDAARKGSGVDADDLLADLG